MGNMVIPPGKSAVQHFFDWYVDYHFDLFVEEIEAEEKAQAANEEQNPKPDQQQTL